MHVELVLWAIPFQLGSSIIFKLKIQTIGLAVAYYCHIIRSEVGVGCLLPILQTLGSLAPPPLPRNVLMLPSVYLQRAQMILHVGGKDSRGYQLHGVFSCGPQMFSLKLSMVASNRIQLLRSVRREGHRWVLRSLGQPGVMPGKKDTGRGKERFLLSSYWSERCHVTTFKRLGKSFLWLQLSGEVPL